MRSVAILLSFIAGLAGTACTKHNALSCNDGVCSDPNFPFCDESGQFGEGANTCIAVTCTPSQFQACRGNDALVCNAVGNDYDVMACPVACEDDKGGCVECVTDTNCSNIGTPHCSPDGACVACLENSQCGDPAKPYCDGDTHDCRACALDDECDSKVCDAPMGTCVNSADVFYASPAGGGACTFAQPCTFQGAVTKASTSPIVKLVKLLPGTYGAGAVNVTGSGIVIHGDGATMTGEIDVAAFAGFSATGLTFTIPAAPTVAIKCAPSSSPPSVTLDRVSVTVPQDGVVGCTHAIVTRSTFKGLTQGVLLEAFTVRQSRFDGGELHLPSTSQLGDARGVAENCVFENANPAIAGGGVSGPPPVRFSTFSNATVSCSNKIDLANDIMVSSGAVPIETGTCVHHYVLSMPAVTAQPGDDHLQTADPKFKDATHGDFHLTVGSPAIDAADPDPAAGIMSDFDGTARPQGNEPDIGAFEYKP